MKGNYEFVASLGENCACAELLKKLLLRQESSPFDWLRGSSFPQRIQLILNNFSDFLNEKYLKKIGIKGDEKGHITYIHLLYGIEFLHDFPSDKALRNALPAVRKKYIRRILRFQTHLRQNRVLLVFISRQTHTLSLIMTGIKSLKEKYPAARISLLYIEHNPNLSMTETIEKNFEEDLYYVQLNNSPTNYKDDFLILQGNISLVNDVICRYSRGMSYQEYLSLINSTKCKILKALIKFFSSWIPIRKYRHNIRNYLFYRIFNRVINNYRKI